MPEWFDPTSVTNDPLIMGSLVGIGLLVGFIGGLFGISGCFLAVPLLAEVLGIPYVIAAGSSSVHAVGISATGLRRHLRHGKLDFKLGAAVAAGAALGAISGSQLMGLLARTWSDESQQFYLDTTVRIIFLTLLGFIGFMFVKGTGGEHNRTLFQRIPLKPHRLVPGHSDRTFSLSAAILTATFCGAFAGFLGLGGGVFYMPLLILGIGIAPHDAVKISLLMSLCTAIGGASGHVWAGNSSLIIAMLVILGSSLGVQVGVHVCHKIHGDRIRQYFALVIAATFALIGWKLCVSIVTR